jgi:Sulfotransferase family
MASSIDRDQLFFLIGPLRTGSSLLSRCIDDHPAAICLCESEINRALFPDYCVEYHCHRMTLHGLSLQDAIALLDRKKQDDIGGFLLWHAQIRRRLSRLYSKGENCALGDKSPDYYRSPELVEHLVANYPLIYTVRDPRAILGSIECEPDVAEATRRERWETLSQNYSTWKPRLGAPNILCVKYEDLVESPEATMRAVYKHVGLPYTSRFMDQFCRPYPERFHWNTNLDRNTGARRDFDPKRTSYWRNDLRPDQVARATSNPLIVDFMDRFGYEA